MDKEFRAQGLADAVLEAPLPGDPAARRRDDAAAAYGNMFDLSDQTVVITGGARGIGLAIADGMSAWGAEVVLVDVDPSGQSAADDLQQRGRRASFRQCDVTSSRDVNALFESLNERLPGVTSVINGAGVSARIAAEDYPDADLDRMIDLNLKGVFYVMRAAAKAWITAGRTGRIINIASFAGLVADPFSAPYAATKGAVVQLTRTCAVEWAPHGILVNAIAPGYVRTEMTAATLDSDAGLKRVAERTPLGRPGNPEEIAGAAIFLAARASSYVTGHVLCVDGGWTVA